MKIGLVKFLRLFDNKKRLRRESQTVKKDNLVPTIVTSCCDLGVRPYASERTWQCLSDSAANNRLTRVWPLGHWSVR